MNSYIKRGKFIITVSILIIVLSTVINLFPVLTEENNSILEFEYINTKDISLSNVMTKEKTYNKLNLLAYNYPSQNLGKLEEVKEEVKQEPQPVENRRIWYLPTEMGRVSQYPSWGHVAYDITSPRGASENIFPIANGVISAIYQDNYGAKIVMINHNINGALYTSQYVHLSAYASGLYVGKPVTINDCIGRMGTTGISTGVHLHISVVDNCNLNSNANCSNLGQFFRYNKLRFGQGFRGLGSVINVPGSWNSR